MSSPDLIGRCVGIPAADHPRSGEQGVVIAQQECCDCGYDDLTVRLDDGSTTKVYEPEVDLVG